MVRIVSLNGPRCWYLAALLGALIVLTACAPPPIFRPREGAQAGGTPGRAESGPPPTLVAAANLQPTSSVSPVAELAPPSPSPSPAASPGGSPGVPPIITGLQPAPGSILPAGDILVGARITATSDLTDVLFFVDDLPMPVEMDGPPSRMKTVSMVRGFSAGKHLLRIQARDDRGAVGGYRWEFTVGTARQALPTFAPRETELSEATATPFPIPTRRPTITPIPKPEPPKPAEPKPATPKPAESKPAVTTPAVLPILIPAIKPNITPVP